MNTLFNSLSRINECIINNTLGIIFINLVSSFLFVLVLLWSAKPKVFIVPIIIQPGEQENHFQIKIINKTLFSLYDIKISLFYYETFSGPDNILNFRYVRINLKTDKIDFISKNKLFNNNYGDNCIVLNIRDENLKENLKLTRKNLELKVTAKHQLTGLSNITIHRFIGTDIFVKGRFKQGNSKIYFTNF